MNVRNIQDKAAQSKIERDYLVGLLLDHINCLPDPKEVFELLDVVRRLGGLDLDEASLILHLYWEDK